jgi:hypothetical protein
VSILRSAEHLQYLWSVLNSKLNGLMDPILLFSHELPTYSVVGLSAAALKCQLGCINSEL